LKSLQNFFTSHAADSKFFQELNRFSNRHERTMPQKSPTVTRENRAAPQTNDQ
jgi:hypothetical protein